MKNPRASSGAMPVGACGARVGGELPAEFIEHRLTKSTINSAGFSECQLEADLLMIYRSRRKSVVMLRIGTHRPDFMADGVRLARGRPR